MSWISTSAKIFGGKNTEKVSGNGKQKQTMIKKGRVIQNSKLRNRAKGGHFCHFFGRDCRKRYFFFFFKHQKLKKKKRKTR